MAGHIIRFEELGHDTLYNQDLKETVKFDIIFDNVESKLSKKRFANEWPGFERNILINYLMRNGYNWRKVSVKILL